MTVKRIKPLLGKSVPFPFPPYGLVPADGARVEWPGPGSYWARREAEPSIEVVEDVQDAPPAKKRGVKE